MMNGVDPISLSSCFVFDRKKRYFRGAWRKHNLSTWYKGFIKDMAYDQRTMERLKDRKGFFCDYN